MRKSNTSEGDGAPIASAEPQPLAPVGVVAVAAGEGLSAVLRGLGATVVRGGQTMNPSTQEILDAINAAPAERVIVLPNNGNIVLAARQAAEVATKPVQVVPSKSVPQGIAALARFVFDAALDENVVAMTAGLSTVRTGEVTRAVRDATIGGVAVRSGSTIGLIDDVLTVSGGDPASVTLDLLHRMGAEHAELISLYRGGEATEAQANDLRRDNRGNVPECVRGDASRRAAALRLRHFRWSSHQSQDDIPIRGASFSEGAVREPLAPRWFGVCLPASCPGERAVHEPPLRCLTGTLSTRIGNSRKWYAKARMVCMRFRLSFFVFRLLEEEAAWATYASSRTAHRIYRRRCGRSIRHRHRATEYSVWERIVPRQC